MPEDLGNGVRFVDAVVNSDGTSVSTVKNYFWSRSEGGFDPLLFGMGAATLAFFPIRRALLTEGESDMLLLPTMLRETLDVQSLTFQVVPGLSKTRGINLPILARNGKGVAFALDYDGGGRGIESKIKEAKYPKDSIFYLRGSGSTDCQLEDFVNPKVLAHGATRAFEDLGLSKPAISASSFRSYGRLDSIAKHYGLRKVQDVPKILIAYRILDYIVANPDEPLIDPRKKQHFKAFADSVCAYFKSVDVKSVGETGS